MIMKSENSKIFPARLLALAGLLAAAGACGVADRMSGMSLARAIQASGEPAEAVVIDIWDTGITLNDDPVVGLRVRVERKDRPPYEATIEKSLVSRVRIPQVQPGCRVLIYVDRNNPSRAALAPGKY
jgi:hypothetical protein